MDRCRLVSLGLAVALIALLASGCGSRTTVDRSYHEGEDALGERTASENTALTLHRTAAQAELTRAKALARDGRCGDSISLFHSLHQKQGVPEEVRAEALLRWAEAEGNLLNPQRDVDHAVARLELFEAQFPKSALLPQAGASLERLRASRPSGPDGGP
jgi:hypothetical protein